MSDEPAESDEDERPPTTETGAVNVADPVSTKQARRRGQREDDKRALFWKAVFADKIGRAEMWGILQSGHAFEERFATGPNGFPQPEASWCEAGEQRLAFRLYLSWLRLAPEGVALMLSENHPALAEAKPKRKRE